MKGAGFRTQGARCLRDLIAHPGAARYTGHEDTYRRAGPD